MKKVIASLVAVAGMSVAANAVDNTSIVWQVSRTGAAGTFSSSIDNLLPGQSFVARAVVSYTGTAAPLGLASFVFQPTVSNFNSGDTLTPFVNGGQGGNTSTPPGVVADGSTTEFGRVIPWGRSALTPTSFMRGHTHTGGSAGAPAGNWLRIAQNHVTSWFGSTGNTTGGSGIPISQLNDVGRNSNDPAFHSSLQGINVFTMKITVGPDDALRTLAIDSPTDGFGNRNSVTGDREVYWFASMTEITGSIRGTAVVAGASVTVVPSPASLALLGLGGLAVARRRRA